jgi:magnesium chelatase accessory protein
MSAAMQWSVSGLTWPNRSASQFVEAGGLRWHVQKAGSGPTLLLLHGTGAATHSWRGLFPLLARFFTVIAPDLPGHGFTAAPDAAQHSLPGFAGLVHSLLGKLGAHPALVVGHSAGAAVALRMCLDGTIAPAGVVSINGAILPLQGLPGTIFSPLAKLLAANPLVPRFFSWRAGDRAVTERLLRSTGSTIDAEGISLYVELMRHSSHAAAALNMMANWDLTSLQRDIAKLSTPLLLLVADNDRTVPPSEASRLQRLLPASANVSVHHLPHLGHLAHEEAPEKIFDLIHDYALQVGALSHTPELAL